MNAISKLMQGQVSKEQFLKMNAISDINSELERGLISAYQSQNSDEVEDYIYLVFVFEVFEIRYVDILSKLLISDWHYKHEDIVILLERISSIKSLDYLYNAIELHPSYLEWDDNYAFEVKCVRAIYYIGKEEAYPYLEKLCVHENSIVREMAQRQIRKIK